LGFVLAVVLWTLAFASLAAEPEVAARATAILNQVEALSADGVTRRLARGDLIYVGETLTTGPKGRAQLRFTDRGVMTLRPATRLSIDDYRFDPAAPALNRQNLSVDQGGFRAATGAVADSNREGYRVASPLGVVGVRGTNYEAVLTPSNNLVLGAYEGTIDVTSPTGNVAVLGEGADFNFARVDSSGDVEYLLEPPEELASSAGVADDQEDAEESEEDTEESEDSEESEEDGDSGEEESEDAGEEAEEEGDASEDGEDAGTEDSEEADSEESGSEEGGSEEGGAEEGGAEEGGAEEGGSGEGGSEEGGSGEGGSEERGSGEGGPGESGSDEGGPGDGGADGGGGEEGGASAGGDGNDASPEQADGGEGNAGPSGPAESTDGGPAEAGSDSSPGADGGPPAGDGADTQPAGAAENTGAQPATGSNAAATGPVAATPESGPQTGGGGPAPTGPGPAPGAAEPAAPPTGGGGDVGGLDAGLTATTDSSLAAAAPPSPVTNSATPDASALASSTVDPSSRGALPADQDEPDQAGSIENLIDSDGDGIGDAKDLDDDGDGVPDLEDAFPLDPTEVADFDEDGVGDVADLDDDGDGVEDLSDAFPFDANEVADFDEDGIGDVADLDDDGDGVPDLDDPEPFNSLVKQLFPVFALEEQEAIEDGSEVGLLVTPEGLLVGASATAPEQPSLFAGSRVSSALPAANRSARVQGSSDFLNGNSVPSREPLGGGLVAQVPGLSWQKLRGPITIFDRFEDDRSFRTLSEDLLLASGVPQNLTLFQDRLHLTFGRVRFDDAGAPQLLGDRAGAAEVLTQSLSFEELYGSAAIDLVTGEMIGALDLVLADPDASPEAAFPRYLATFTAQLAQGELAAVDSTGAEYLLTDSSASVLDDGASVAVTLRFPALAEIAGFITGDSAEYLQLAFGFDTTAREGAGVQGLALLKSNAVTAAEQSALTTGHGFVGALCCDNQDITLLGGLASDPTAPPLLAVMVDAQGEPVAPGVAGFARFTPASEEQSLVLIRPASGDLVTALEFPVRPGTEGLIAQRWDRPMDEVAGSSIDVFLASSGALLPNAELTNTLFTLSGIPTGFSALQGTATYRDTDLIDAAFIGFPLPTEPGGIDPFAGFSVSFDIDFGSGLISQGHLGFGSDPAFETEILFSGQVFAAESGNSVALFVEQGILRGLEVDPQQSLLGGFFVGAEGEAFAGAFSLATNQPDGPVVSGLFVNSRFPLAPVFDGDQTAALFGSSELALTTTLAQEAQAPGLRFGLGFNGPDGPLVATATGPDPVAGILSARNAEVFPEGTVLLSGNLSGGFTEAAVNPGGVEGLFWYRWPAPVRVFSDPRNSELFSDLDRALLVAVGTPTNLADLTATTEIFFNVPSALLFASTSEALVSLDGGGSLESSPSSATFGGGFGPALGAAQRFSVEAGADFSTQQVFGYGVLDLQQGAFQGGLELVLGSSQGASESR